MFQMVFLCLDKAKLGIGLELLRDTKGLFGVLQLIRMPRKLPQELPTFQRKS